MVGAAVVGAAVVGAAVVRAAVVGAAVVGASVVGGSVVGAAVVGAAVGLEFEQNEVTAVPLKFCLFFNKSNMLSICLSVCTKGSC